MTTLQTSEQHIASLIDHTLANFFKESLEQARSVDSHYALLWENLARLHASGGKRIRPKIVVMSYLAFGGQDLEAIIPIACAQELLHFSMLIHDDIIDRDLIRYGVDNITGSYQYIYEPLVPNKADRLHYANSAAILAGDLMIAGAHRLITQSTFSADKRLLALSRMYESIFQVAGGELIDTESSFYPIGAIDPLTVILHKTASYSFVGPCVVGSTLADAPQEKIALLQDFATHLGIAFQLTDDLLGVFGDEAKTGKSNTGDIREGKKTYLIERTRENLSKDETTFFNRCFGTPEASDDDIQRLKDLIISSGAKKQSEDTINDHVAKARLALSSLDLNPDANAQFEELIIKATKRQY